ncbi:MULTISPECIES: YlbF family regulator [Exiguobacterium]|uniref:UPF0342 protein EXIGUO9Y_110070 n=1 Tax=Exiguobacterium oxidotolerans TaxID=223958 RepID=A0A653I2U7_9BACL|nr:MULTISPECIES: YlbF family regulator [Exiguobacterium]ASI34650.1 YlbF family regulator [Exiguobacterium sp. N4-1P]VWX33264.1 conserved hypothetical protein [Exiguobacterium oxidotolerans]
MSETNLYDHAYTLERALRETPEYTTLQDLYTQVNADPASNELFASFRNVQLELQQKQMEGEEITPDDMASAQAKMLEVQNNPLISQLMQEEQRMHTMLTEVTQIIMKPLEELYAPMMEQNQDDVQ